MTTYRPPHLRSDPFAITHPVTNASVKTTYIPPHRRNLLPSVVVPTTVVTSTPSILQDEIEVLDPLIKHFSDVSSIYKAWLKAKREYSTDPAVDAKFKYNRNESLKSIEASTGSYRFRDQFRSAMDDVNTQTGGALGSNNIQTFLDLGCAPGGFSKWLLEHNRTGRGFGVTLPASDHGLSMFTDDWNRHEQLRYECLHASLTDLPEAFYFRMWDTFNQQPLDLVICGARYRDAHTAQNDRPAPDPIARSRLTLWQLLTAFQFLRQEGTLILVSSLNMLFTTIDILVFLREHFRTLLPTKGNRLHGTRSSYYLVCQGFRCDDEDCRTAIMDRIKAALESSTLR